MTCQHLQASLYCTIRQNWPPVVTFAPLKARFPGARLTPVGVEVPLDFQGPEEILAACCAERLPVRGSVVLVSQSLTQKAG